MKIGIDIIDIADLKERIARNPEFINKILTSDELAIFSLDKIAGKIAAKEAVIKTGYLKTGKWLEIQILNTKTGEPKVVDKYGKKIGLLQVSISHSATQAVAVAVYQRK